MNSLRHWWWTKVLGYELKGARPFLDVSFGMPGIPYTEFVYLKADHLPKSLNIKGTYELREAA